MTMTPNPRHDARFERHKASLLRFVSLSEMRGLEIGAFDLPFVTPEEGSVEFADYASTEDLIEEARANEGHSPDFVVPVNYVLSQGGWAGIPNVYDWIAAAHVIEHAPSMIDWLHEAADKLNPGGILFLVVPDKRYTFDFFRPESTLGKILEDHFLGKTRPGPAEVFDTHFYTRSPDLAAMWDDPQGVSFDEQEIGNVFDLLRQARNEYINVHCNVFSQRSFSVIVKALCREQVIPFSVEEIGTVDDYNIDFHCVMRKT